MNPRVQWFEIVTLLGFLLALSACGGSTSNNTNPVDQPPADGDSSPSDEDDEDDLPAQDGDLDDEPLPDDDDDSTDGDGETAEEEQADEDTSDGEDNPEDEQSSCAGCWIDDLCIPAGQNHPGFLCAQCDPERNTGTWSAKRQGTDCRPAAGECDLAETSMASTGAAPRMGNRPMNAALRQGLVMLPKRAWFER